MPDDNDDAPSEFSELDLSEDAAITGDAVQENLGVPEGDSVRPNPEEEAGSEVDKDLGESIEEA